MSKPPVHLAPPGAGIPRWQMLLGKHVLLPVFSHRLSWERAVQLNEREGLELVRRSRGLDEATLCRRVLVPPQMAIEDSSRFWSYAMVLEHLTIVGLQVAETIVELTHDREPTRALHPAEVKPAGQASAESAIQAFEEFLARLRKRIEKETPNRRSRLRAPHPWMGPLDAYRWLCFIPLHQRVHRRQAARILRGQV